MKTLYPDLFPETLLVSAEAGRVFTTSLTVAEHFKKRHTNVLRAVENLLADIVDPTFAQLNFGLSIRPVEGGKRSVRNEPMYELSHDGFALLAMGFTGKEALEWKIKFLAAFRDMERQLLAQQEREANALYQLRPRWQPIAQHPDLNRQKLLGLTGHKSAGSITACRRRMRQVGLIR